MKERPDLRQSFVKVVETSDVTGEELTRIINEMIGEGWRFDTMHFAMRDSSRRPAMAFLIFYHAEPAEKMGVVE